MVLRLLPEPSVRNSISSMKTSFQSPAEEHRGYNPQLG